jgi:hypothetical protein
MLAGQGSKLSDGDRLTAINRPHEALIVEVVEGIKSCVWELRPDMAGDLPTRAGWEFPAHGHGSFLY